MLKFFRDVLVAGTLSTRGPGLGVETILRATGLLGSGAGFLVSITNPLKEGTSEEVTVTSIPT